jgi:hypothetical protein
MGREFVDRFCRCHRISKYELFPVLLKVTQRDIKFPVTFQKAVRDLISPFSALVTCCSILTHL